MKSAGKLPLIQIMPFFRRLCPDISFFQQATDFPCQEIVGGPDSDSIRLHNRVQYTALSAGTVERRGIGMNKVNFYCMQFSVELISTIFITV